MPDSIFSAVIYGDSFGTNLPKEIKIKSLLSLICEQLNDRINRLLLIAALTSFAIGMVKDGPKNVSAIRHGNNRAG